MAPAFCKQHALHGMVNVVSKRCVHKSCLRRPSWGTLADVAATVCTPHKGDILGGLLINFRATCNVQSCRRESRWGLEGRQPTHCSRHGPLVDGLVYSVGKARRNKRSRDPSYVAVRSPSIQVKTELSY